MSFLCALHFFAQEYRTEIEVDFGINSTKISPAFSHNKSRIADIYRLLGLVNSDSLGVVKSVWFCGTASPEGSVALNQRLAKGRMQSLENLIRSEIEIPDSLIERDSEYIPWSRLAIMVDSTDIEHKSEILDIMRSSEATDDERVIQLKQLDGGKVWRTLLRDYFGKVRSASVVLVTYKEVKNFDVVEEIASISVEPVDTVLIAPEVELVAIQPMEVPDTVTVLEPVAFQENWGKKFYFKTNMLSWAMLVMNIVVEIDTAPHWSFTLPVYYSGFNYFRRDLKFRTFTIQPEMRYWFRANDGWFVGAHLGLGWYNYVTPDKDYRIQDKDGSTPAWGGGVSGGFRMPVFNKHWLLEFSLGVGVYCAHYDRFRNEPNGFLVDSRKATFFGIDQAAVSLVYTIDYK